ncbi:hypothetical protein [Streptomyces sp. NPDC003863]
MEQRVRVHKARLGGAEVRVVRPDPVRSRLFIETLAAYENGLTDPEG